MRITRLLSCFLVVLASFSLASAQSLETVYSHDFETQPGNEWSKRDTSVTPIGLRHFLGEFGGEPVVLELHDLEDHCSVTVSFELFVIDSWEGSVGWNAGPDVWDLNVSTGPPNECPLENLLHTTFANCECDYQAYPENFPNVHNRGLNDADEVDTLGYDEDSVYYLSFTFFHDESDLYFTFQGSPDLQPIGDESWGLDNVVVEMDTDERYCCRASRRLPVGYGAGFAIPVEIEVTPNPRSQAHLVQETPPSGWGISGINNGGVFESASGTIKWGPWLDTQERTLAYTAMPPFGASGDQAFAGIISVDGESEPLCGDTVLAQGGYHPADTDTDWQLEADEFTAYAAAWMHGDPWTDDFHPIPGDFVTNAGMLWRSGEGYVFDASTYPPWESTGGAVAGGGKAAATFRIVGEGYVEVAIVVTPLAGTSAYVVEDMPPTGWEIVDIAEGGQLDASTRRIKWGPFVDGRARVVTYVVRALTGQVQASRFVGTASFDGVAAAIGGIRGVAVADPDGGTSSN